jgi:hypothetical protein
MGPLKKLILFLGVVVCLFLLSYTPFNLGDLSFKFQKFEISTKVNFLLIAIITLVFLISCVNSIVEFVRNSWKIDDEKENQERLIELLFQENAKSLSSNTESKYQRLERAIICHLYEVYNVDPPCLLSSNPQDNKLLFAHENRVNIRRCLREHNISRAKALIMDTISRVPQYCRVIQNEILELSKLESLDFDPRQYRYNLPPNYVEKYMEVVAERERDDVSLLLRAHRNYPGNVGIALNLIKYLEDDKKIIEVIKKCFEKREDRRLAAGLLLLKNRENLLEIAEMIALKGKKNVESLWFMCIIASELGHISMASALLGEIMRSGRSKADEVVKFFLVNHSKFAHDVELTTNIKEYIKNYEDRDS